MAVLSVLIPGFMHYINDQFLEARGFCLFVLIVFDMFNNSKKSMQNLIHDSKY